MNKVLASTVALGALTATSALAGGIDRREQGIGFMFEQGSYLEFGMNYVMPDISGVDPAGLDTGDMAEDFLTFGVAYKTSLQPGLDLGFYITEPYGADGNYTEGAFTGVKANWTSYELGGIIKYKVDDNFSVYGGLRVVQSEASVTNPVAGYSGATEQVTDVGYLAGVAYERPEIALRAALTYRSAIEHEYEITETSVPAGIADFTSTSTTTLPQSVTLDFQTGVNPKTLVFGSIKWTDWTETVVNPQIWNAAYVEGAGQSPLVSYEDDVYTFTGGLAYRVSDEWAVLGSIAHETSRDTKPSALAPTDGFTTFTAGARYSGIENMTITGGISYRVYGDIEADTPGNGIGVFEDNDLVGIGLTVGMKL